MVRFLGFGVGLIFLVALLFGAVMPREASTPDPIKAVHKYPQEVSFSQDGVFGTFDRAELQRGFQVYKEVCSACHGLERIAFRNLRDIGFSEAEVKAIAKAYEVPAIDQNTGEATTRPGLPADHFPSPYANAVAAAAANNNAIPPDLSLIVKARPDGKNYLYSLLTGYEEKVPEGFEVTPGLHFNPYFHSVSIAMARPLQDDQVSYSDGTKATTAQMARDVTAFLHWAAEPEMEKRKQIGVASLIFLTILTILAILSYRRVWAGVKH